METGADIWFKLDDDWVAGSIINRYTSPFHTNAMLSIRLITDEIKEIEEPEDLYAQECILKIRECENEEIFQYMDDLTNLTHLNEPSILSALEYRFVKKKIIYTNTGPILLAVNPYENLNTLYDQKTLHQYYETYSRRCISLIRQNSGQESNHVKVNKLPPHVYSVAANAFNEMIHPRYLGMTRNQSILISGESGAGKTETTKFLMQYLALAGDGNKRESLLELKEENKIEDINNSHDIAMKVLEINPLLESLGNAKTLRNDNSSRFGKFIKLHFKPSGILLGATIQTYLLEKTRIVSQAKNERNYHIFYQMCSMTSNPELTCLWKLQPATNFLYLNQSSCFQRSDGVDDIECFKRTINALKTIGFTKVERNSIFQILSSILYIGNLKFEKISDTSTQIVSSCETIQSIAADLLCLNKLDLEKALCERMICAGNDNVLTHLNEEQANNSRDGLVKALYSRLFDWLVEKINSFLKFDASKSAQCSFIGILDIFGFEIFPQNSFEQLCINYANEALQQQFNEYVFKMEQLEYEKEKVEWQFVEFLDNQECVDLIGQRHVGILALIDEIGMIPRSNDLSLARKLYEQWTNHSHFDATRVQQARGAFMIKHYAGSVTYNCNGFLEKNKDLLHHEATDLLKTSKDILLSNLFSSISSPLNKKLTTKSNSVKMNKRRVSTGTTSVGHQFKTQLSELLCTIQKTTPNFIRCIKPNDDREKETFVRERVSNQLKCNGVLEAVRVARAGFPVRIPLEEFVKRYSILATYWRTSLAFHLPKISSSIVSNEDILDNLFVSEVRNLIVNILPSLPTIFNTTEMTSFNGSMEIKDEKHYLIRCLAVGLQQGKSKIFLRNSTFDALENWRSRNLSRYTSKVQSIVYGFFLRQKYLKFCRVIQLFQCRYRYKKLKLKAIKHYQVKYHRSIVKIQSCLRMFLKQKKYQSYKSSIIILQTRFRFKKYQQKMKLKSLEAKKIQEEKAKKEQAFKEQALKEQALKEQAFKEQALKEQALKEQAFKEQTVKEQAIKEQTFKKQELKHQVSKERIVEVKVETEVIQANKHSRNEFEFDALAHNVVKEEEEKNATGKKDEDSSTDTASKSISYAAAEMELEIQPSEASRGSHFSSFSSTSRSSSGFSMSSFEQSSPMENEDENGIDYSDEIFVPRATRVVSLPKLGAVPEKQWVNDEDRFSCHICNKRFNIFRRKHHCRNCGEIICGNCSLHKKITGETLVRVCVSCVAFHSVVSPSTIQTNNGSPGGKGSYGIKNVTNAGWNNPWPQPPFPKNESGRIIALRRLNLKELGQEGIFSMFCDVAARTLKCPMACVSILEEDEQIVIANMGMSQEVLPRELAFDSHAICDVSPTVILDTTCDKRFVENPMVKGDVKIRFYAGAPIITSDRYVVGVVSVLDTKPRRFLEPEHLAVLQNLSALASEKMAHVRFSQTK